MAPKFIFVRHGEAEHNVAYHKEGVSAFTKEEFKDAPLTPLGIEQGQAVGKALANYKIVDIWCSPLTRAIQTAEEIFEEANVQDIYLHDALLEFLGGNNKPNERKPKYEIKKKFPGWKTEFLPEFPPMWVESEPVMAQRQRMKMFVLWAAELYKDESESSHVVIVSHKNVIQSLTGKDLKNGEHIVMTLAEILAD